MFSKQKLTRRQFICSATTMVTLPLISHVAASDISEHFEESLAKVWRPITAPITDQTLLKRELVRYATLAASSHNTQCWKFKIQQNSIVVLPDFTRRCPAVDPDNHHLFVSLGAATENLLQAALYNGLHGEIHINGEAMQSINIALLPTKPIESPLFKAIPHRQCTRAEYDSKPLSAEELKLLALAGTGNGVQVLLHTKKQAMENILEYVVAGNSAQMHDPAFMAELKSWIRFNSQDAVRTGDGLYSAASGNPSLPKWLGGTLFDLFFNARSENDQYAKQLRSSAGVAIFVSNANDRAHWLEVGRCYERFALQATALGIRSAFLNQAVKVPEVRQQFANYLNVDEKIGTSRIDLVVRFGRGGNMPQSLRRLIDAVLI